MELEENICLKCKSNCCKLQVDITKSESDSLHSLGYGDDISVRVNDFLKENPYYKDKKRLLDDLCKDSYASIKKRLLDDLCKDSYASINKGEDGYCAFLNRSTRLCNIYENRPSACVEFSNQSNRCREVMECLS